MNALMITLLMMAAIFFSPVLSQGQTPYEFPETEGFFITQYFEDHFLVVENFLIKDQAYWALWKLNKVTRDWELLLEGQPFTGEKIAIGYYFFDPVKNILIWRINFSSFLGCAGPEAGISVGYTEINEPFLSLGTIEVGYEDMDDDNDIELELTRVSGTPGQIEGRWSLNISSNSYIFDFKSDGNITISGDLQTCLLD